MPALRRGAELGGRSTPTVAGRAFVVVDEASAEWVRRRISFYGSTPSYRPVLEAHGWGALQDDLNALSKQGRWDDMAALVEDSLLDAFAVRGSVAELPQLVRRRFGGLYDRVCLSPAPADPAAWSELVGAFG
jgi:hypothetical protein